MVKEVWLHIGTPKSGTSSLQKYLMAERKTLSDQEVAYLTPGKKTAYNDLAISINRARPDLSELAENLNSQIMKRPERCALISSEMLYGTKPATLKNLIPALVDRPLKVLVYLRRQDRFIEAMFLQKAKNGRFKGPISAYIDKFDGSGSDYQAELADWEAEDGVDLVPRILERDRLIGGDVVADACAMLGVGEPKDLGSEDVNVSPGLARVQLLQAAATVGLANPRRLQRQLAVQFPQQAKDRAPILDATERQAYVDKYAQGNEALRAKYFPNQTTLFDIADLKNPAVTAQTASFTDAQLAEITHLLRAVKSLQ